MLENTGVGDRDTLQQAISYAEMKWQVLPIATRDKKPSVNLAPHGLKDATTDVTILKQWFALDTLNVGIRTGSISGIWVLDIGGENGRESLADWEQQYGQLPSTVESITGGGGRHLCFNYPTDRTIGNKVGLGTVGGIDVRGDHGYIVAPPSTHESGKQYQWEMSSVPGEVEIADAPSWLLDIICKPKAEPAPTAVAPIDFDTPTTAAPALKSELMSWATKYLAKVPPAIQGQGGDNHTFNTAGHVLAARYNGIGLTDMEVLEVMRDWNSRCSPSWTESELLKKIHSARDNGTPRAVKEISGPEDVEYWTDDADADRPIELDIISLDDVQERPIDWLWKDRFELGGIGLIFGDPSAGKSTASYDLAARVSTGTPWPDGSECKQGYVLLATCEDQIATTVKPKIRKSKGNPKNIGIINCVHKVINGKREEYTFTLSDVKLLERSIIKTNARLVIIDPVGAYMNKVDTHKDADIRQLLGPLAKMAEKTNCAIILVMHMNKNTKGVKAMYRVIGSIGFIGAARSAFAVVTDATDIVSVRPTPSSIRGADLA